jgi:hypothetical protein
MTEMGRVSKRTKAIVAVLLARTLMQSLSAYVYVERKAIEKEILILCHLSLYCDRRRTSNYRHYPNVSQAEVVTKSDLKCTKPDVFSISGMRI